MNLRVWWPEMKGIFKSKPTGNTLTGIAKGGDA